MWRKTVQALAGLCFILAGSQSSSQLKVAQALEPASEARDTAIPGST